MEQDNNNTKKLERFPFNGTFELTARCNLRCKMCLIRIDHQRMIELGGRERTADEWIRMAREVREAGTVSLLLTGGEPMVHPDFISIYRAIAQMGFLLTLYTNATLVTEEIMEVLREYPPHILGITVYGASAETYEKVTGSANAYYRMLEGVEQLRQLPSKLELRTTIIKDNAADLPLISGWAHSLGENIEFNVSRIVTKPVRGGIADVTVCRLTPEQNVSMLRDRNIERIIKPLDKFIQEHKSVINSMITRPVANRINSDEQSSEEKKERKDLNTSLYGCEAGMISYTITWDGKLIGCQMLGDCWTEPFVTGFQEAWKKFPEQVKLPPIPKECVGCDITCTACPANRLAETGSMGGLPEYLCKESKLSEKMRLHLSDQMIQIINGKGIIDYEEI